MVSKRVRDIEPSLFFFNLCRFRSVFRFFIDFDSIWDAFGKVLGGFGEGLGRILGRGWEDFGGPSKCGPRATISLGEGNLLFQILHRFAQLSLFSWRDFKFSSIWEG